MGCSLRWSGVERQGGILSAPEVAVKPQDAAQVPPGHAGAGSIRGLEFEICAWSHGFRAFARVTFVGRLSETTV
jgi:hypothetical protein